MPSPRRIRIRIRIDVRCKINTILEQCSAIRIGAERRETTIIFVQNKGCMSRELNNIRYIVRSRGTGVAIMSRKEL